MPRFGTPQPRCWPSSSIPGPQAVFEDSAHMMFAVLPDLHLVEQIDVTRDIW